MKPAEHIKRLLTKLDVDPSPEMRERTLTEMIAAHVRQAESRASGLPALWALMARYGAAGAAIAAVVLGILIAVMAIRESAAPVYAVEQTVEAIKKVPVVHIFGRDWDDRQIEMWVKINPETGLMDSCQISHLDEDRFLVSTPRNTYDYDRKTNTVRIKDGPSVASIFCLGDFFGGIEDLAKQLDGKVTYCGVTDPGTKRNLLELKMSAPNLEIVCLIDSRTKLPISIDVTRGVRFNRYDILRNATLIRYDDAPPEGLFDFTIPAGANITIETSQDPLQSLPVSVLRRCGELHLQTTQEVAKPLGIPVNTRLFFVNGDFTLRVGGFMGIRNDSNEVRQGEVGVGNMDPPNIAIFDAATGKKQQIRLVQHRQSPPGRFRVYWQLDEPLAPGQTRYGIYWQNDAVAMQQRPTDPVYPLVMNNRFGAEGIENFVLIVPAGISVHDTSTEYKSREEIEGYSIYIWQRHLPKQLIVNEVQVLLSPPPKLPYEGVDGLVEFVHRIRQAIAVERVYQIETKEEFVLAKDQAARLTFKDNPANIAEFLFVYDGNAVHVIYRGCGETEREYNSTWLDLSRPEDSRTTWGNGATTYLKCVTTWEPKDGRATVRFHTEKPSEQEQQNFLKSLQAQEEYKKQMQAVREQAIAVREWDLDEKVEPYTITMDDPNDPNMVELRTKYGLEDLVRGAADDYEKLKRVTAWVQKQWEHNGNNSPSKSDPLTILKEVSEGKRFRCVEYAIVVTGCTRSLGMSSRTLGLMRPDVETAESGAGHVVSEVWLRQFGKWVMVDGQWGAIAESKGVPLNAVELQDAIARKDAGLTIRFVSQTTTADRQANYIEWIIPYLYYFNFGCDQRFYRSAAQGQPSQRGPIMLIPKGANKPKAFQRHASFGGATYISNPKAFYPPMDRTVTTQPYEFNTSIKATLEKNSEIRLDCPANPYGVNRYTIYYHVDKSGMGYVGIRAALANGKYTQCEIAAANCDCILQQPSPTIPYLGILMWQLNDGRLDIDFHTSNDKEQNYRTVREYTAGGKRVCEQYVNRRLVLPDSIGRRAAIEDVDLLVERLKAKHPKPFAKTSEKDFNEELERLKAAMPEQVRIADLSLSVAALLALVGDDHTRHRDFSVFDEHIAGGGKVFPVRLRYKDDRMTVTGWSPEVTPSRMKAGDIVVAVNGQTMESLLHRYGRYMSLETDLQKWWTLERGLERYQVLLGDARDQYTLQMQDGEGRTYSETLPAVKPWLEQYERSKPQAPRFHHQFYEDDKVCLFKLQTFNWDLRAELEAKANALVAEMKQNGTRIAILDLRGNGGGNSNMGAMVFTKLMDKPYGELRPDSNHSWPVKLALLCDRSTYSAASFEAMYFKDYRMGIVAGEETGGRASSFGDIEHVRLPNSFLSCGIATAYFPRRAGTDDGRGVVPDLPLDVTLDDGVLVEKICAHIRSCEAQADKAH